MAYPKAILFDLDDTLIDYSGGSRESWREVCRDRARTDGRFEAEALFETIIDVGRWFWSDPERHRIGRSDLDKSRRDVARMALERMGIDDRTLADEIGNAYVVRREQSYRLFPRTHQTLTELTEAGVVLGLVTNGEAIKQRDKITRFDLARYFDCIVIEGEFGVGKPEPSVFRHALVELGVEASKAWMVGDNFEWDVAAPMTLGMKGIWNNPRGKPLPAGVTAPYRIVRDIGELVS
jgi:putative hydrolase of the HAD superfamily